MAIGGIPASRSIMMNEARQLFRMTNGRSFRQFPWWELRWRTTETTWSRIWMYLSLEGVDQGVTGTWYYPLTEAPTGEDVGFAPNFFNVGPPTLNAAFALEDESREDFEDRINRYLEDIEYEGDAVYHYPSGEGDSMGVAWITGYKNGQRVIPGRHAMALGPFSDDTIGAYGELRNLRKAIDVEGVTSMWILLLLEDMPSPQWVSPAQGASGFELSFPDAIDCIVGYATDGSGSGSMSFVRPDLDGPHGVYEIPVRYTARMMYQPPVGPMIGGVEAPQWGYAPCPDFWSSALSSTMTVTSETVVTGEYNDDGEVEISD